MIVAPKRGPRGSIPGWPAFAESGFGRDEEALDDIEIVFFLLGDSEGVEERFLSGRATNASGNGATCIEDQSGRGLHDVEAVGNVRAAGDVNVDVPNPRVLERGFAQEFTRCRAFRAHFGRELNQGRTQAKTFGAVEFGGGDATKRVDLVHATLAPAHNEADNCCKCNQSDQNEGDNERIHDTLRLRRIQSAFPSVTVSYGGRDAHCPVMWSLVAEIEFRSDVTVELVRSNASDADVLFAARVSTMGEQTLESSMAEAEISVENEKRDRGLINYLMRDRHGSPFEHNSMTFYVQAPIFVFREFMRHRIASYNEESGRYRELRPVFYVPGADRNLVQVGKPGAYDFIEGTPEQTELTVEATKAAVTFAYEKYEEMLAAGVAREVARGVLPVATYSSMYVTMNARSLMNFLSLRTKRDGTHFPSFPQREIEMVAEKMEDFWAKLMPLTYEAFNQHGRVSP